MTVLARLREVRGGVATVAILALVIGVVQVGDRAVQAVLREAPGFSLAPVGAEVARLSPITVTFPSAPAERAAERVLLIEPAARGTYAWLSPRTALFQPDFPGLLRGQTYTVSVPARPEAGLPDAVTRRFTVGGKLVVQQVIPGDGDAEVPLGAPII
ncbi:MAG TPA: hypothetical protein VJP45_13750, partial [Candidatus Limnocylindria bacterium]|nr:hypothetical protein [Candidatus Limnocylindria bacterium]